MTAGIKNVIALPIMKNVSLVYVRVVSIVKVLRTKKTHAETH